MSLLGIISILLGALTFRIAILEPTRTRIRMFAILYIIHLAAAFVYFAYVQVQGGDSELYYYDELDFYNRGFALGRLRGEPRRIGLSGGRHSADPGGGNTFATVQTKFPLTEIDG